MSIFDIPTTSDAEIMADIKKRMANSQTVTDDELRRITGSTEPQVIMPLKLLTKLLEQSAESKNNRRQLSEVAKALNWQPPYQASLAKRAERLIESNDAMQEERSRLKECVRELEKSSISRTLLVARLQEIPDAREMNLHDAEIIWSILEEVNEGNFDFKEQANEG